MKEKFLLKLLCICMSILTFMPTTHAQLNWTRNATPSIASQTTLQANRISKENHKQIPLTQQRINANIQQLNEASGITIYGFSTNVNDDTSGLIHFSSDDPWTMTRVKAIEEWPTACAYGNDAYYAMLTFAMMPKGLYTIDLETGEPTLVADYMYNENVRAAIEMSYDYTTNTMFMLTISDESNWSTAFGKVDLTTGEQTIINPNMGLYHRTLAVDQDGVVWTIDEDGGLNTIDKATGTPTLVHNLNCYPFNRQSMEFDRNTGELYWAMCDSWDYGILYKVDVTNGTRTELGYIGRTGLEQVIGLHIPYTPCAPGAPGAISNLNILPGESGALTATISWVNPTTTHSGEALSTIDKIELFRNGELLTTLTTANPGESMSYTDNLDASGTYTYKIVLHNSEGAGMASSSSAFIGRDVPSPVTITSVTREGENAVKIAWEASTTGVNGGYLETASIRYKVTRISDDTVLAENLSETTFTDNTITSLARYRYQIEVSNADGVGGVTNTAYIVNGPAQQLPLNANFTEEEQSYVWSIGDANADGVYWFWSFNYYDEKGYYFYETEWEENANDWLISPIYEFAANTAYKMVVMAKPASAYTIENMEFYLVKNYDLSTAIKIGETFDVKGQLDENEEVILSEYRVNFSDIEAGKYSVAVRCTSNIDDGRWLAISSIEVAENHDGNIRGSVWDNNDNAIEGAKVSITDTDFTAVTNSNGEFEIANVPAGTYSLITEKLGYISVPATATVTELKTTNVELDVVKRNEYPLTITVNNEYGSPIANVAITVSGYNTYSGITDNEGILKFEAVYEHEDAYIVIAQKDFYENATNDVIVSGGEAQTTLSLSDCIYAPATVQASSNEDETVANISWAAPGIDTEVINHSSYTSAMFGSEEGNANSPIGVVCYKPMIIDKLSWLTYNDFETVNVIILALNENGEVTSEVLYRDDDAENWMYETTPYTLSNPVYAPNGCFIGLSVDEGDLGIATAENSTEKPFLPKTNAYIDDLSIAAELQFVENLGPDYEENFRITYSGKMLAGKDAPSVNYNIILVDSSDNEIYRYTSEEINYTDYEWAKVTAGDYRYAVEAVYENGKISEKTLSDVLNKSFTASISEVGNDDCDIILNGNILIIPEGISSVTITNIAGHTIYSDNETKNIDTSNWATGIYIVTFASNDKTTSHKFILK